LLISAGAQMICVLEPSGMMLGPDHFSEFSAQYVKSINDICRYNGIACIYHICGSSMHLIEKMCEIGVDALSLDSPQAGVDLPAAAEITPADTIVIGNINPVGSILYGYPDDVHKEVISLLESMKKFP